MSCVAWSESVGLYCQLLLINPIESRAYPSYCLPSKTLKHESTKLLGRSRIKQNKKKIITTTAPV